MNIELENKYLKYVISSKGVNLQYIDKITGENYCLKEPASACAQVKIAGQYYDASLASYSNGRISLSFGQTGVSAVIGVTSKERYLIFEVLSLDDRDKKVEEFVFANIILNSTENFAGCAMALNLKTNVIEVPQANKRLRAMCYPKFGFSGAQVAIIGCPKDELRTIMQEVVKDAPELPKSSVGGPWAMDSEGNRGSYMFNFGGLSEDKADEWIDLAKEIGINQIDFHGGNSFRFGDCYPNPETYPRGMDSFKAVIDRLHDAGILAGLHTYAFFIDKRCPWVTPTPDPRLAKDATFTLAQSLSAETDSVPVIESTQNMSTITGFFVRNSVTIQIDDELITYAGISKESPYAFTNCKRGAYGTKATSHEAGAKAHHLKECFGLFVPDPNTTLLEEVAARMADMYNYCGFDMIYLDALDGEDILGGWENSWHYGSKFVFEIFKRLEKSPIMEMSTFHHHLWYVRARMGAWDHPTRSHKKFIDIHCAANEDLKKMFLPGQLGWWAVKIWSGPQGEPTFTDDIEYLCCKAIGTDNGISIMGIFPDNISKIPIYERLAKIMKEYEELRRSNYFSESVKNKLKVPGDEFTLIQNPEGKWRFQQMQYDKHKVEGINGWSNEWKVKNKFGKQPLCLRIEALTSAGSYDAPENIVFTDYRDFPDRATAPGISVEFSAGENEAIYSATNNNASQKGSWSKIGKQFSPNLNLSNHQALGVWVYGDGKGEVLNFQLRSPEHISHGIGEHYVLVDFIGWRYFELIEPEGERYAQYSWSYGDIYSIYRESVNYNNIDSLSLWYNNIPKGEKVSCRLRPVKAMPLAKIKIVNPKVTIDNKEIVFPVEIESGSYLEFYSMDDCKLYAPNGELIKEVIPQGYVPILDEGENVIKFDCNIPENMSARANVTVISRGFIIED